MSSNSSGSARRRFWIVAAIVLGLIALLAYRMLSPVEHLASAEQSETVMLDCPYEKFRQIMIRKNATAAMVAHGGMTLIDQQVHDLTLDTSRDERPILNALRGRSKSDLTAIKEITVSLDDPMLEADRLVLRQQAEITEAGMVAETKSKSAAGRLKDYQTNMEAAPSGEQTEVRIRVALDVLVRVPPAFKFKADQGVQQAADRAVAGQAEAMRAFVAEHRDKRIILPEF